MNNTEYNNATCSICDKKTDRAAALAEGWYEVLPDGSGKWACVDCCHPEQFPQQMREEMDRRVTKYFKAKKFMEWAKEVGKSLENAPSMLAVAEMPKVKDKKQSTRNEDLECKHPAQYVMSDWECRACAERRRKQKWICPYCDGDHKDCSSS